MSNADSPCHPGPGAKPGIAQRLRCWLTPRDGTEQYLAQATDLADLERRQRELARAGPGPAVVTFNH